MNPQEIKQRLNDDIKATEARLLAEAKRELWKVVTEVVRPSVKSLIYFTNAAFMHKSNNSAFSIPLPPSLS